MTPGRLAVSLGAFAGVGLVAAEEELHLRPAMFVAVGLTAVLTIVVVVGEMEARRGGRGPPSRDR